MGNTLKMIDTVPFLFLLVLLLFISKANQSTSERDNLQKKK